MTITDGIIVGALLAALFMGAVWVGRKATGYVRELIKAFGDASSSARMAATAAQQVVKELAYMRALTTAQVPGAGENPHLEQSQYVAPSSAERPKMVPFPDQIYDRFERVPPPPDAEVGDTSLGLLNQTDADLVAMEALEAMRQRGIQVEDSDTEHDGVVADAD